MRIHAANGSGYTMWLSATDTGNWANKVGAAWPCSTVAHHRLVVCVDSNGLCDLSSDSRPVEEFNSNELKAIVADHLPEHLKHLWPTWAEKARTA